MKICVGWGRVRLRVWMQDAVADPGGIDAPPESATQAAFLTLITACNVFTSGCLSTRGGGVCLVSCPFWGESWSHVPWGVGIPGPMSLLGWVAMPGSTRPPPGRYAPSLPWKVHPLPPGRYTPGRYTPRADI